jgi:CcmD family protein
MQRIIRLVPVLLALTLAPRLGAAQEVDPNPPVSSTDSVVPSVAGAATTPAAGPANPGSVSGLQEPAGPPRTLRAYGHVFIAFALAWVLLFGYALSLGRRFGRLEREVDLLVANTSAT